MADDKADSPHTAITSWSGFVYQGKVAIYHVLQLLKVLGECTDYVLQLDSLEDFAILKNGAIESMHQVKAWKSQNYDTYKGAFVQLVQKTTSKKCDKAYFHMAKEITDKNLPEIESIHPPVKIYPYNTAHSCPVDEIDMKIEEAIKILLVTMWPGDTSKHSTDYVGKARNYLDQIVLKQVLKIHGIIHANRMPDRQAAYIQTIPFSEFLTILKDDLNQKDCGPDYYFYVLLNDLHRYYQDFCIQNEGDLNDTDKFKLSWCMLQIEQLEKDKARMIDFIRNIIPHRDRKNKFDTLTDYKDNTFNKEEIKWGFLRILRKLKTPGFDTRHFFNWQKGYDSFSPTAIIGGPSNAQAVCRCIIENAKTVPMVLFERNNLITMDIDVDSIIEGAPEIIQVSDPDNIMKWKKVRLISLAQAETIINV